MNPEDPENVVFSRLPTAGETLFEGAKSFGKRVIDRYANAAKMGKEAIFNSKKPITAPKIGIPAINASAPATPNKPGMLNKLFSRFKSSSPTSEVFSDAPTMGLVPSVTTDSVLSDTFIAKKPLTNANASTLKAFPVAKAPAVKVVKTTPIKAPIVNAQRLPMQNLTKFTHMDIKNKWTDLKQKLQNNRNYIYYILGFVVAIIFVVFGSILMTKKVQTANGSCESGDCYATADAYGNITLSQPDPNMNDNSDRTKGLVMLLFGVACLCLVLVMYFRKQ